LRNLLFCIYLLTSLSAQSKEYYLVAGTYTTSGSKGIYVYRFDDDNGKLAYVSSTAAGIVNPSYLTFSPDGHFVYACTDTRLVNEGSVSSFSFDRTTGTVRFIGKQPSGGANPVYVAIDKTGKWLVNANYTGGSISVFPVSNGSIAPYKQLIQPEGHSINTARQDHSHIHSTVFSPADDYLFAPDLGTDKIMVYKFESNATQPLVATPIPFVRSAAGSGPRHFAFHPNGKYAYCIEELGGTVTAYQYHDGGLDNIQRIASYKQVETEYNSADIHISPDGNFLYATNRNRENNISIFSINTTNGLLSQVGYADTHGKEPRNFIITPSGNYLLVADQVSGSIIVFKRDRITGLLKRTRSKAKLPEPSCLQMISAE
jgi:6-phosphogluconolactonase